MGDVDWDLLMGLGILALPSEYVAYDEDPRLGIVWGRMWY